MNIHRHMQQQLMRKKEALNLEESQEVYIERFTNEGIRWRNVGIIISKMTKEKQKPQSRKTSSKQSWFNEIVMFTLLNCFYFWKGIAFRS